MRKKPKFPLNPLPFELSISARTGGQHAPFLRKHLSSARALIKTKLAELSVALVGDARMSALHRQYLNMDGPTDVLTFPLDYDGRGRVLAGEVVVCVPFAVRQGRRRDISAREELLLYALHGMLHLSGFDDRTDAGYRQMHAKEDEILTLLGLDPVFAATVKPGGKRGRAADRTRFGA